MPKILVKLTDRQAKTLAQGKRVLVKGDAGSVHEVDVDQATYKRFTKAHLRGKGCLIKGEVTATSTTEGGKINLGKIITKNAGKVANEVKKAVPKKVAKEAVGDLAYGAVMGATTYMGAPNPQAASIARKATSAGVDAAYKTNWEKGNSWDQFGKNYGEAAGKEVVKSAISGSGARRPRLVKGSAEAKAHMAHLRSMRGGGMKGCGMAPAGRGLVEL